MLWCVAWNIGIGHWVSLWFISLLPALQRVTPRRRFGCCSSASFNEARTGKTQSMAKLKQRTWLIKDVLHFLDAWFAETIRTSHTFDSWLTDLISAKKLSVLFYVVFFSVFASVEQTAESHSCSDNCKLPCFSESIKGEKCRSSFPLLHRTQYLIAESRMLEEGMKKPPWRPLHLLGVSTCFIGSHMFTHFPHNLHKYTGMYLWTTHQKLYRSTCLYDVGEIMVQKQLCLISVLRITMQQNESEPQKMKHVWPFRAYSCFKEDNHDPERIVLLDSLVCKCSLGSVLERKRLICKSFVFSCLLDSILRGFAADCDSLLVRATPTRGDHSIQCRGFVLQVLSNS